MEEEKQTTPLMVSMKEATRLLSCCRQTLYKMRRDKQIAFGRMRGRAMVPMAEINRILAQLYPAEGEGVQAPVGEPAREPPKPRPKKTKLFPMDSRI